MTKITSAKASRYTFLALLGVGLLLWLLAAGRPPRATLIWAEAYGLGHIPLFGVMSLLLLVASRDLFASRNWRPVTHYLIVFATIVIISVLSEWLQLYVPERDAQIGDAVNNILGATCFLALAAAWRRDLRVTSTESGRRIVVIGAVLILLAALSPLAVLGWKYGMRAAAFPVIADFDSSWQQSFLSSPRADLNSVLAPPGWTEKEGQAVSTMQFHTAPWPGVIISEPYPDWRGYETLRFDVFSLLDRPVPIVLHVSDVLHNDERKDRFNRIFTVNPGLNEYAIATSALQQAPVGREMQLSQISRMVLFTRPPKESFEIYLSDIWLE
ncbi:MAG: VanZ family protein [Gammaproteobacteria bacterium]